MAEESESGQPTPIQLEAAFSSRAGRPSCVGFVRSCASDEAVSRRTSPVTPIGDRHGCGGWAPQVPGRVGRPADGGKVLAAIVVRAAAAGKTVRVPPAQ